MGYIYPKKILTTTGHSKDHHTQKITNPENLCSGNSKLAYWGVKNPTWVGNYMRNYYDSVTTISGTYYKPEVIYATDWDISGATNKATVGKVTIQYAWEQVSYSCGNSTCYGRFDQPTITLTAGGKSQSFKGAKPDAIRYDNSNAEATKNTNNADLKNIHSYTVDFKHKVTVKDFKNMRLKFDPAKNNYHNHVRIIMQFIRIKIETKEPKKTTTVVKPPVKIDPIFKIESLTINADKKHIDEEFTCTCVVRQTQVSNDASKNNTQVRFTYDYSNIDEATELSGKINEITITNFNNNLYTYSFSLKDVLKTDYLYEDALSSKNLNITASIINYPDANEGYKQTSIQIIRPENPIAWGFNIHASPPYTYKCFGNNETKEIGFDIYMRRKYGARNIGSEYFTIEIESDQEEIPQKQNLFYRYNGQIDTGNHIIYDNGHYIISPELKDNNLIEIVWYMDFPPGEYNIWVVWHKGNKEEIWPKRKIVVLSSAMQKEFFKLRLEDGSDVRYNYLSVSQGDDLITPLEYTIYDGSNNIGSDNDEGGSSSGGGTGGSVTDDYEGLNHNQIIKNLKITGETLKIPVNDVRFVSFDIKTDDLNVDLKNVFCYLDIYNDNGYNCSDVIIGADNQIELFQGGTQKYCSINNLKSGETKKIRFIVQSEAEQHCFLKIKPFNYDEKYETVPPEWTPCEIYFEDDPNIQLSIKSDKIEYEKGEEVIVDYYIENKSNIDGGHQHLSEEGIDEDYSDALKYRIKEPNNSFEIMETEFQVNDTIIDENDPDSPYYNEKNKIITFPYLPAEKYNNASEEFEEQKYDLRIKYKALQTGIFDFTLSTVDDEKSLLDDQSKNSVTQKILVGVKDNVKIKTYVSNYRPYIDELIDYTVEVTNYTKAQDYLVFCIKDIGDSIETEHDDHYTLEYANYPSNSEFIESENCNMGKWILKNVQPNETFKLVLTLRPLDIGYHTIQTIHNLSEYDTNIKVLERNKQIEFDVSHAVSYDENINCENCDLLTKVCDDDFINLGDDIFYVFTITNNNRNPIETPTHIYARLPDSFLDNDILCHSSNLIIDKTDDNNLIITIPNIKGCETTAFCFKVQPSQMGTFVSNFMVTNKNAHVLHKQLILHVDEEFDERKIEHQIDIYNFEKTNRYFRYELDGDSNLYKFFNQGDRPLKYITSENYERGALETFRGTNLKEIAKDIKDNSKYVEPELLKIGTNKLKDTGYEIYPDSFMRRFGLLNSEIFHFTGQLPTISNVADRAMRWNQDMWDTKVWGGGIYDNGVFDLSVNYEKIPKNFSILDTNKSTINLQSITDKVKPFGTQAICHYNFDIHFNMGLKFDVINDYINYEMKFPMKISDIGLISMYHGNDNSLRVFYDMMKYGMDVDLDIDEIYVGHEKYHHDYDEHGAQINNPRTEDVNSMITDFEIQADVFPYDYSKKYVFECLDIIKNYYSVNKYTENIDFVKYVEYIPESIVSSPISLMNNNTYTFCINKEDKITIQYMNEEYNIQYIDDSINNFNGFGIKNNDELIFARNIQKDLEEYYIQIQKHQVEDLNNTDDRAVIHIWISSNGYEFYHLGYMLLKTTHYPRILFEHYNNCQHKKIIEKKENGPDKVLDDLLTFYITNEVKTYTKKPTQIVQFNYNETKWDKINNIKNKDSYTEIQNNEDIDTECKNKFLSVPPLALKYKNFNISKYDEITDVALKLKVNSNKEHFDDDIVVNIFKDAEYYLPDNHIERKNYYPQSVNNVDESFITNIKIQQPNITICSDCMKTSLGLYDTCQYCGSEMVSHYEEKKAVTICDNCGYISDGWHEYCPHCLSLDITKTKVDFNKTYCYDCQALENDYYKVCPKCFSKNVLHMTNDEKVYEILNKSNNNIKPMTIKTDLNQVNMFNMTVPLNINNGILKNIEDLKLHIHGYNNNDATYYYCKNCGTISIDPDDKKKCPNCSAARSDIWIEKKYDNMICEIFNQDNNVSTKVSTNQLTSEFDIEIDLLKLVSNNENIKLLIYAENKDYKRFYEELQKLDISEEAELFLAETIPILDIVIDNIYYSCTFINQKQWIGLENLKNSNHNYIQYSNEKETSSQKIIFSDFGIPKKTHDHLYLHIQGYNKSDVHINSELIATDKDGNYYYTNLDGIEPDLFDRKIDLLEFMEDVDYENLSIEIFFKNIKEYTNIMITNCYITAERNHQNNRLHSNFEEKQQIVINDGHNILIKCAENNLWGILDEAPGYYDGNQLSTGIVCYVDFGKINAHEYIRIYDANLIISYKNKLGHIITDSIPVCDEDFLETFNELIKEDEMNEYEVNEDISKYIITYDSQINNAEMWGSIKTPMNVLNNLESEVVNNRDDKFLGYIPLFDKIIQSFISPSNNIGSITFNYDNRNGYPGDEITIEIYNDDGNDLGELLFSKNIIFPYQKANITVDVDIEVYSDEKYWIVLIDNQSDENNYHRFKYNKKVNTGNLIYKKGNTFVKDQDIVLSFGINTNIDLADYNKSPRYWNIDRDIISDYKLYQNFYRYNIEEDSNAYINNLYIENGFTYKIKEEDIEEDEEE